MNVSDGKTTHALVVGGFSDNGDLTTEFSNPFQSRTARNASAQPMNPLDAPPKKRHLKCL